MQLFSILHKCENLQLNVLSDKTLISDVLLNRPCKGKFAVLLELLFEVYWMVIWLCCKIGMCWCEKQRQVATAVRCLLSPSSPPKWEVLRWEWSPPSSCSPSYPNSQGTRSFCGNKLTGKVNIKVWKEPLPLVVSSVTEPRTSLTAALNHERRPWIQTSASRDEKLWCESWRDDVREWSCFSPVVKEMSGVLWPLGVEIMERTSHLLYICTSLLKATLHGSVFLYIKTLQWPICFIFILLYSVFYN